MFEKFGLTLRPFAITPDSAFLVWAPPHRAVFDSVVVEIGNVPSAMMVTGEIGTGKTLLANALISDPVLQDAFNIAFLRDCSGGERALLSAIDAELGGDPSGSGEPFVALRRTLERVGQDERGALIVLDEVQSLDAGAATALARMIEHCRMEELPVSIVLFGQIEFATIVRSEPFRALDHSLAKRFTLVGLPKGSVKSYIRARLETAGATHQIFDDRALALIEEASRGIPRRINKLCEMLLYLGARAGLETITVDFVRDALKRNIDADGMMLTDPLADGDAGIGQPQSLRERRGAVPVDRPAPRAGRAGAHGPLSGGAGGSGDAAPPSTEDRGPDPTASGGLGGAEADAAGDQPRDEGPPAEATKAASSGATKDRTPEAVPADVAPSHEPSREDDTAAASGAEGVAVVGSGGAETGRGSDAGGTRASGEAEKDAAGGEVASSRSGGPRADAASEGRRGSTDGDARPGGADAVPEARTGDGGTADVSGTRKRGALYAGLGALAAACVAVAVFLALDLDGTIGGPRDVTEAVLPVEGQAAGDDAAEFFQRGLAAGEAREAAGFFARAALRGHDRAARYLGQFFATGDGMTFSPAMAARWYAVAETDAQAAGSDATATGGSPSTAQEDGGAALADAAQGVAATAGTARTREAEPILSARAGDRADFVWDGSGETFTVELGDGDGRARASFTATLTAASLDLSEMDVSAWRVAADDSPFSEWTPISTGN